MDFIDSTILIPVWFDDQGSTIHLPSSVFASEFEEDVGLLNKAAPVSGNPNENKPNSRALAGSKKSKKF